MLKKYKMREIYLLWGATTTGKTTFSVALSKRLNIPVISLDRFQGYTEISTASGSPTHQELQETDRIYVTPSRKLVNGVISAESFNVSLKKKILSLENTDSVIFEGGSVSVLNEMIKDGYWSNFFWHVRIFATPPRSLFLKKAKERVFNMIHPKCGSSSILEEINSFFNSYQNIDPLKDIDGYREIIDFYERKGIHPDGSYTLSSSEEEMIIQTIADKYYEHALWQEQEFKCIPSSWSWQPLHG